jgi:hypothetical protein
MSVHFHKICQYGFVHEQCRCPSTDKTLVRITCPPEFDAGHAANSRVCRCEQGEPHTLDCPSWGI